MPETSYDSGEQPKVSNPELADKKAELDSVTKQWEETQAELSSLLNKVELTAGDRHKSADLNETARHLFSRKKELERELGIKKDVEQPEDDKSTTNLDQIG